MDIPFTYKILSVDNEYKLMQVEYSAEGYDTVVVSMPLPFTDTSLEQHLKSYAPESIWVISKKVFQEIVPGVAGEIVPMPAVVFPTEYTPPTADQAAYIPPETTI